MSRRSSEFTPTEGDVAAQAGSDARPNVVVVLFDDLGFAQLGCFGGTFDTPNIDRLGRDGLRYNRFHVTSVCSASRASLLTGRNHHAVGVGSLVADNIQDFPGYTGRIPKSAGTLPRVLREARYSTFAVGKWHLTPYNEMSAAGPFDRWPLGLGFERYYGFLDGEANQWAPLLTCDNHFIEAPRSPEEGYHLSEDLADQAIKMVLHEQQASPGKPFFLYFAPGAMHAPHHVAPEWSQRYLGRFDQGWDRWREEVFARQLASGLVPEGTVLTERPPWVQAWDSLSSDERRLFARMHEVYAGFLTHADAQIGRLIDAIDSIGQLDNTLIIVGSDNGASGEGGPIGSHSEFRLIYRLPITLAGNLDHLDDWGGFRSYYHYAWGWAWAGNTPLRLWKRYTWLGGTRVPLIVHWPRGIAARGEVRSQIVHINDVMPTILDAAAVDAPDILDGVAQQVIDGKSFTSSFEHPDAPSPRQVQYFEMQGSRAIICGEWKATTNHISHQMENEERLLEGSRSFEDDHWSLARLDTDFSEAHDVALQYPEVIALLERLWYQEAERNHVLPMFESLFALAALPPKTSGRAEYQPDGNPIDQRSVPSLVDGARITAFVDVPAGGAQGVLCALGDWNSGFALYVREGRLVFALSVGGDAFQVVADEPITPGEGQELTCVLTPTENDTLASPLPESAMHRAPMSAGGTSVSLLCADRIVGSGRTDLRIPGKWGNATGFRLGADVGLPVSKEYTPPFSWTGILRTIRIEASS